MKKIDLFHKKMKTTYQDNILRTKENLNLNTIMKLQKMKIAKNLKRKKEKC